MGWWLVNGVRQLCTRYELGERRVDGHEVLIMWWVGNYEGFILLIYCINKLTFYSRLRNTMNSSVAKDILIYSAPSKEDMQKTIITTLMLAHTPSPPIIPAGYFGHQQ